MNKKKQQQHLSMLWNGEIKFSYQQATTKDKKACGRSRSRGKAEKAWKSTHSCFTSGWVYRRLVLHTVIKSKRCSFYQIWSVQWCFTKILNCSLLLLLNWCTAHMLPIWKHSIKDRVCIILRKLESKYLVHCLNWLRQTLLFFGCWVPHSTWFTLLQ